jgi:hypothetical protein
MFQKKIMPPSSGSKSKPKKQEVTLFAACFAYSLTLKTEAVHSSETQIHGITFQEMVLFSVPFFTNTVLHYDHLMP